MPLSIPTRLLRLIAAGLAVFFIFVASADAQVVPVGEYRCWTPEEIINDSAFDSKEAAKLVSGFCKYQARGINGQTAFSRLDEIPQRIIKRGAPNVVSYVEPRGDSFDYTITWWIEGDNPNVIHPANHVIGRQLQLADVKTPLTRIPSVEIRAMIFSLDQTKEREIGLNIAANFAKTADDGPGPFDSRSIGVGAGSGLFDIVGGVSDDMASAIQIGFSLSSEQSYAKEQLSITNLCPVGGWCQFEDTTEDYFIGPTGIEKGRLGIRYSLVPVLGLKDDEIKLENMQFSLGLKTDDPKAPVNTIRPISGQTHILKDGELHVLGSEIREFDSKGSQLLGKDKTSIHSRMIILISASLKDGEDTREDTGLLKANPIDRSFSETELDQLNDRIEFYDILKSFEKVCFDDVINPMAAERICGFHLRKMNPNFVDSWVDIRVDPKRDLAYPENHRRLVKLGDIYQGKGYYQIPMLNAGRGRSTMRVRIELAKGGSGTDLRKTFKSMKIPVGIQFEFAYTSGHSDPVDVRMSSIAPVR